MTGGWRTGSASVLAIAAAAVASSSSARALACPNPIFVLFRGLPPSSVEQGVTARSTLRLYLLRYRGGTLAIQLTDEHEGTGTLRSLEVLVQQFAFGS